MRKIKPTRFFLIIACFMIFLIVSATGAGNVVITPTNPTINDNLTCVVSGSLANFDYYWFKNGGLFKQDHGVSSILASSYTSAGETWKCEVWTPPSFLNPDIPFKVGEDSVLIGGCVVDEDCGCSWNDVLDYCVHWTGEWRCDGSIEQTNAQRVWCGSDNMCHREDIWRNNANCGSDEWTNNYQCSGNIKQREYKYQGCNDSTGRCYEASYEWKNVEDCGNDYCESWINYCKEDDVWNKRTCHDRGCSAGNCFDNTYVEEKKAEECGSDYCQEFTGPYCKNDDVYHSRTCYDNGCSASSCFSNAYTDEQLLEDCEYGCSNGGCITITCEPGQTETDDCGNCGTKTRTCQSNYQWSNWGSCTGQGVCSPGSTKDTGIDYCYNNNIWNRIDECNSNCQWYDDGYDSDTVADDCGADYCESWGTNYCKNDDVYHSRICYDNGCSVSSCFSNAYAEEELVEECYYGCSDGVCITIVCEPGQTETDNCGNCGSRTRVCQSNGQWDDWSLCSGEGVCSPGDTQVKSCGYNDIGECRYGTQTKICSGWCSWSNWSDCVGAVYPVKEILDDGKDNDCDGEEDESVISEEHELAITSLIINTEIVEPGDYFEAYVKIKNKGNYTEDDIQLKVLVLDLDLKEIVSNNINLSPNADRWEIINFRIPKDAESNEYIFKVFAVSDKYEVYKYGTFFVM